MTTRATRGRQLVGAIHPGTGKALNNILSGTISIDPGSIGAASRVATNFTLTGAVAGDPLFMNPPAGLNDDLLFVGCAVTADNQGTVYLYNPTGAPIDDAAATWTYTSLAVAA